MSDMPPRTENRPGSGGFAPENPTDNRRLYEPGSRWPDAARHQQRLEGIYLAVLGVAGIAGVFSVLSLTCVTTAPNIISSMALVFCSGLLGGTAFDVKWWYHSIAKGMWHVDRRAWRIAVPWQSAVVAMFVHILFKSDLLGILNPAAFDSIHNTIAFGFLVGYFSDAAVAKLAEIAESLFGVTGGGKEAGDSD